MRSPTPHSLVPINPSVPLTLLPDCSGYSTAPALWDYTSSQHGVPRRAGCSDG